MSTAKIKHDFQQLLKMGFDDDLAHIISLANNGCFDHAKQIYDETFGEEQSLLHQEVKNFVEITYNDDKKNSDENIQHNEQK